MKASYPSSIFSLSYDLSGGQAGPNKEKETHNNMSNTYSTQASYASSRGQSAERRAQSARAFFRSLVLARTFSRPFYSAVFWIHLQTLFNFRGSEKSHRRTARARMGKKNSIRTVCTWYNRWKSLSCICTSRASIYLLL